MTNSDNPADSVLEVDNLSLSIGAECKISGLTFRLRAGEKVCLIGASGSGKSLTAKMAIGTPPAGCRISGTIRVNGVDVTHRHALVRPAGARVSAVFQDSATALNPLMTLGKQLSLALGASSPAELAELLNDMGLGDIANLRQRFPAELSGGQRQRVCIALALLARTRLLVADEPTTALDVISQQQVLQVLQERCAQPSAPALLFITHDIAVAAQLCQRGLVMEQGRLLEDGSMAQLLHAPQHPYTRRLVSAARQADLLLPDAGALAG